MMAQAYTINFPFIIKINSAYLRGLSESSIYVISFRLFWILYRFIRYIRRVC